MLECCSIVVLFVCVLVIVFCLVGLFLTSCARVPLFVRLTVFVLYSLYVLSCFCA